MRPLLVAAAVATAIASSPLASTAAPPASRVTGETLDGTLCIAPFQAATPASKPMSQTTWGPSRDSVFRFHVDGELRATVRAGEMAVVRDLSTARRARVRVTLDGRPFEAFSLDLGNAADHRICLWLYPGYWHWIDNTWIEAQGCKCPKTPAERELEIVATTLEQSTQLSADVPVLGLHFDPQFLMRVHVERVVGGDAPVAAGGELALLIHSPTQTYGGQDPTGKTYAYRIRVTTEGDGRSTYRLLSAAPSSSPR